MTGRKRQVHGLDRAISTARRATHRVPAYAKHLAAHGSDHGDLKDGSDFASLPPVTKDGYIKAHPLPDLVWDGDLAAVSTWSSSSGSSGEVTYWPRAGLARAEAAHFHDRIFTECFDTRARSTLVIDAFAMGMWIGGTYTYDAMTDLGGRGHHVAVATPGIKLEAVLPTLTVLGRNYERVILAGYPPSVKDVLDQVPASFDLRRVSVLLAGEGISEQWRDHILDRLGAHDEPERVCLIYGTADAGLMGHETPETIAIRRAACPGSDLADVLFGESTLSPTFVEYDPERRFIEVDGDGLLYFTVDSALPLIRYRLGDRGRLYTGAELVQVLRDGGSGELAAGIDPRASFLVLRDRIDVASTFYGLNIYAEHLKSALLDPAVVDAVTGRFQVSVRDGADLRPSLRIAVESSNTQTGGDVLVGRLTEVLVAALTRHNGEYRTLLGEYGTAVHPIVTVRPRGTGPFAPDVKNKWIEA